MEERQKAKEIMDGEVPVVCYICKSFDGVFMKQGDPNIHHYTCERCKVPINADTNIEDAKQELKMRHRDEYDSAEDLGETWLYRCPKCGKRYAHEDDVEFCECQENINRCNYCGQSPCSCGRHRIPVIQEARDMERKTEDLLYSIEAENEHEDRGKPKRPKPIRAHWND